MTATTGGVGSVDPPPLTPPSAAPAAAAAASANASASSLAKLAEWTYASIPTLRGAPRARRCSIAASVRNLTTVGTFFSPCLMSSQ